MRTDRSQTMTPRRISTDLSSDGSSSSYSSMDRVSPTNTHDDVSHTGQHKHTRNTHSDIPNNQHTCWSQSCTVT